MCVWGGGGGGGSPFQKSCICPWISNIIQLSQKLDNCKRMNKAYSSLVMWSNQPESGSLIFSLTSLVTSHLFGLSRKQTVISITILGQKATKYLPLDWYWKKSLSLIWSYGSEYARKHLQAQPVTKLGCSL